LRSKYVGDCIFVKEKTVFYIQRMPDIRRVDTLDGSTAHAMIFRVNKVNTGFFEKRYRILVWSYRLLFEVLYGGTKM